MSVVNPVVRQPVARQTSNEVTTDNEVTTESNSESVAETITEAITEAITLELSTQAATLRRADIDADAWQVARHCLLDWFGITIAGSADEPARIVADLALDQGGKAQSSIYAVNGTDGSRLKQKVPAAQAALANGTASHALDFDDVNYALHGHATVAVAPALLALAEARGLSLEQTLVAFVAGVEFACAAATYIGGEHYRVGWHATATIGSLGAAAGCARLLQLDPAATAHAVGLAATQSSGLKSMFGTMAKPFHAGRAARTGVEAALMVERGFVTRTDSIECAQGIIDVMHGVRTPMPTTGEAGQEGRHFRIVDTLFKYHASCFETHATIEACMTLAQSLSLHPERVLDQIRAVVVRVRPENFKICNLLHPASGLESKFSLVQTAAMSLAGKDTGDFQNFSTALCNDPTLSNLRQRVEVVADKSLRHAQATVELHLQQDDGSVSVHSQFHDASIPATDLNRQQQRLSQKFRRLCAAVSKELTESVHLDAENLRNLILISDPATVSIDELASSLLQDAAVPHRSSK